MLLGLCRSSFNEDLPRGRTRGYHHAKSRCLRRRVTTGPTRTVMCHHRPHEDHPHAVMCHHRPHEDHPHDDHPHSPHVEDRRR